MQKITVEVCVFFDGNGGMQAAAARRLPMDPMDQMDQMDKMGAPRYTPMVCCAAVRYGSGADLPQGNAAHTQRLVCEADVSAQAFFYLEILPGQSVRDF